MTRFLLGLAIDGLVLGVFAWYCSVTTINALPALSATNRPAPTPRDLMAGPPLSLETKDASTYGEREMDRLADQVELEATIRTLHAQANDAIRDGQFEMAEVLLTEARLLILKSREQAIPANP